MNTTKRTVLGRGLSALIPDAEQSPSAESTIGARIVPTQAVNPAHNQPRTYFDDAKITALSESISEDGILQPIVVRNDGAGGYIIVAGERRYRAACRAGLEEVPVLVRDMSDKKAYELALVENLQREDLNPLEEAEAYAYLSKNYDLSHDAIAQRVGRDRVTITNVLRLLKLPETARQLVANGELTAGHARAILMAPSEHRESLAQQCAQDGWSVRHTEKAARNLKESTQPQEEPPKPSSAHRAVEAQLRAALGAPVKLVQNKGKGRIEIRFHSLEELERLLDLVASLEGK